MLLLLPYDTILTHYYPYPNTTVQSILAFDAETVGSSALASLSAFTPTTEECTKVSAFVLKKYASQLALLEEQKRKEQKQEGNSEESKYIQYVYIYKCIYVI